jgi:hypothetical protein
MVAHNTPPIAAPGGGPNTARRRMKMDKTLLRQQQVERVKLLSPAERRSLIEQAQRLGHVYPHLWWGLEAEHNEYRARKGK